MKNMYVILVTLLFSAYVDAQNLKEKKKIELASQLTVQGRLQNNYSVIVQLDGKSLDTIWVKSSRPYGIFLEADKIYTLIYRLDDYPDKLVMVNTCIPKNDLMRLRFLFSFQCEMSPQFSTLKNEYEEFPVALVIYDKIDKNFVLAQNYHFQIHLPKDF